MACNGFDLQEETWKFVVAKHKVEVLFLLRGMVRTSRVSLVPDRISFGKVAVGKRSEQVIHLSNDEDVGMRYTFDNALMQGEIWAQVPRPHVSCKLAATVLMAVTVVKAAEQP